MEVLRPLGDLIFVQKREDISLEHLRVLVHLKAPVSFPLEIIVDVGISSFKVKLEDDGIPILRSKIVQGPVTLLQLRRTRVALHHFQMKLKNSI